MATHALEFQLESGRSVRLDQLHLLPTMTDWSDAGAPRTMADRIPELVARFWETDELPVLVKPDRSNLLPRFTCLASFRSEPLEKRGVCVEESILIVCWFTDSPAVSVRNLACEALAGVSWEEHARDFHSDW